MAQYPAKTHITSTTTTNNPNATSHTFVVQQPPVAPPLVVPTITGHTVVVPRAPSPVATVVVQQMPGSSAMTSQTVTVQQPAVPTSHTVVMQQSPGILQPGFVQQTTVTPQPGVVQHTTVYQNPPGGLLTDLGLATGAFVRGVVVGAQPTVMQTVVTQQQTVPQPPAQQAQPPAQQTTYGGAGQTTYGGVAKTAVSSPMDLLKPGHVVQVISKVNGNCLRVLENGAVDCRGEGGPACDFVVLSAGPATIAIKLRNVAQPHCYLAISNSYLIGNGQGGLDCDLVPVLLGDEFICFESAMTPGSHIGVLPSGDVTSPAQTNKQTDTSHFFLENKGILHHV